MDKILSVAAIGVGNRTRKYLTYITDHPEAVRLDSVVETNPERLACAKAEYGLDASVCFPDADSFFAEKRPVDAVIIGTPDRTHYDLCMQAIACGYHVLLEKPVAESEEKCRAIARAAHGAGVLVFVCYELRYHPYWLKVKEIHDSGQLGTLISVDYTVNVGLDRMTHAYVRGQWSKAGESAPIFLAKCCHDVDAALWITGTHVKNMASVGSLRWFREENAPEGSALRCKDCAIEKTCPFSAVDLYRRRGEWTDNFVVPPGKTKAEVIEEELSEGPLGRCVYHCGNDVMDNQVVIMTTDKGVNITLQMVCLTREDGRFFRMVFSEGELFADGESIRIRRHDRTPEEVQDFSEVMHLPFHSYSDLNLVADFLETIRHPEHNPLSIDDAIESEIVCLRADGKLLI